MRNIIDKTRISPEISIKDALKKIDEAGHRILFVCDENNALIGTLTDGDIRRRVLKTGDLQEKIASCINRNPVFVVKGDFTTDEVRKVMLEKTIDVIPVLGHDKSIVDILFWGDIFEKETISFKQIDIPVVIMAGGKGERLDPFTKILPKPLIPVGEKPIIELIVDGFRKQGIRRFYATLNYKGEMVKTYFDSMEKDYTMDYIWEKESLGTAGGLKLLPSDLGDTFIVSNCDIIVDLDYKDLVAFHKKNKNVLTVVGSIQHHRLPYGIIDFAKEGKIKEIQEKPEFDFTINTGVYVLSRETIEHIPEKREFDMTEFIEVLLERRENVGVYPISEKSYIDIGQWEEYKKHTEKLI